MLGLIGEVPLQQNRRVAPRIAGPLRRPLAERIDRDPIPTVRRPTQHGERQDITIWREDLGRGIARAIVVNGDLVLARELLEHLADAPEQQPDRRCFVVRGNADVKHPEV
jgi:hypothetical protein